MRVLFTSMSGLGHIQPMLPLALALTDRGHELLWATAADAHPRLARHDIATAEAGIPLAAALAQVRERFPQVEQLRGDARSEFLFPRLFGLVAAGHAITEMRAVVSDFAPAVVISEAGELTGPLLASSRAVPHATHGFGIALPAPRVQAAGEMMAELWREEGRDVPPHAACYEHLYIDIFPPDLSGAEFRHMPRVVRSGPQPALAAPDEMPPPGLEDANGLVYITFGTIFNGVPAFGAAVAGAARLGRPTLVTLGPGPVTGGARPAAGAAGSGTAGPVAERAAFDPAGSHVHFAHYVAQGLVLPRSAVVVSHGGSGTVLGALAQGVPQLCLPQGADQFLNAAAISRSGAGLQLHPGVATADAVEVALRRLLEEPAFAVAAKNAAASIARMPAVETVADAVESLVFSRPDAAAGAEGVPVRWSRTGRADPRHAAMHGPR